MKSEFLSNKNRVLRLLIKKGDFSAPDMVRNLSLSRPTVDTVLSNLLEEELIKKKSPGVSTGGRRPFLFSINGEGLFAIGIVVSIPDVTAVIVDLNGKIYNEKTVSMPIWTTGGKFLNDVTALIQDLMETITDKSKFIGVSLAIPGLVDSVKGISIFFSRLSNFFNTPLKEIFEKRLNVHVDVSRYLGSSAYADIFTKGESLKKPIIYIELGEGIDMALFSNGKPYRGSIQNEGGLGHMVIEKSGRTCLCGSCGCLEAYASTRVLIDELRLRIRNGEKSSITLNKDIDDKRFYKYVEKGDDLISSVAEKGMDYLALGISNIVNLLNPAKIIISGALIYSGDKFLENFRQKILLYSLNILCEDLDISFTPFNYRDGAKGIGLLKLYKKLKLY